MPSTTNRKELEINVQFGDLNLRFMVDEDLGNYMQIQHWMRGLGYPEDMKEYEMVKAVVRSCNSSKTKFRVEKKGRKPTNGFNYFGDPKGGMKNATLWDVYVYRRYVI